MINQKTWVIVRVGLDYDIYGEPEISCDILYLGSEEKCQKFVEKWEDDDAYYYSYVFLHSYDHDERDWQPK